jgi:hypothetical protein
MKYVITGGSGRLAEPVAHAADAADAASPSHNGHGAEHPASRV